MSSAFIARLVRSACKSTSRAPESRVQETTEFFLVHYNQERPNQARSCRNQPPHVAYPAFPMLPTVPQTVDPDHWLVQVDKRAFARIIRASGTLTINREDYYVSRSLAGQRVTCWVNAAARQFAIWQKGGAHQIDPDQRPLWPDHALRGLCGPDEAGGALRISAVPAHPSPSQPRSPVGLNLKPAPREGMRHQYHEFPARGGASLCLPLASKR
jgi:hypothetical protein